MCVGCHFFPPDLGQGPVSGLWAAEVALGRGNRPLPGIDRMALKSRPPWQQGLGPMLCPHVSPTGRLRRGDRTGSRNPL